MWAPHAAVVESSGGAVASPCLLVCGSTAFTAG